MIIFELKKEKFDQKKLHSLINKIREIKSTVKLNPSDTMKGYRYEDDDRIAQMILSQLYHETNSDYTKTNEKFLSLNEEDIVTYIDTNVKDAAYQDWHYKYDKDWD